MAKVKPKKKKASYVPHKKKAVKKTGTKSYSYKKASKKPARKKSSDGCFLTSACVEHYNLSDSCHQLTTLRRYRDQVLLKSKSGKRLIHQYYQIAPEIVKNIYKSPGVNLEFENILKQINQVCCFIEARKNGQAKRTYIRMVRNLLKKHKGINVC